MVMPRAEAIEIYTDDIIFLQSGRLAALTHPLKAAVRDLCNASYCRIFAVMMIASIESALKEWKEKWKEQHGLNILTIYFKEGAKNGEKIKSLRDAFEQAGVKASNEIIDDYLAIKYLRNVIVHARWKPYEKELLESRGFPTDARYLNEEHWKRMQVVNQNIMFYIFQAIIRDPSSKAKEIERKLLEVAEEDDLGIIRKKDIPRIYWFNMERICSLIYKDMERSVLTEQYNWANGLSESEIQEMPDKERKRLFWLAARKAGKDRFELLGQHQELAKEGLDFWKEFWRLTFERVGISYGDIIRNIEVLSSLHQRGIYPTGAFVSWPAKETLAEKPVEIVQRWMDMSHLQGYEPLEKEQVASALHIGSVVYDIMPNIAGLELLLLRLPIVDPGNSEIYLEEAEKALAAMELNDNWYSYAELRNLPDITKWTFFRDILEEFRTQ